MAGCGPGAQPSVQTPLPASQQAVRYFPLSDEANQIAQTPEGREFLKYLVGCALPEGMGAIATSDGNVYELPGSLGLAPNWLTQPMTEREQRWVSAGILARTNFFGKQVRISMRNPGSGIASLQTSEEERSEFSIHEGDFFGNLFAENPVACVAVGRRTPTEQADAILHVRVGTEIDPALGTIDGQPVSRCRFIVTGYSDEPGAHTWSGVSYPEYISVYLKPLGPAKGAK